MTYTLMGGREAGSSRICAFIGALLSLTAIALMASGIGTNFYYTYSSLLTLNHEVGLGMFKVCLDGNNHCSSQIDSNCKFSEDVEQGWPAVDNCDEFNAIRALAIIAVIFSAVSTLVMLCSVVIKSRRTHIYAAVMGLFAAAIGAASMFVGLHYRSNTDSVHDSDFGKSFYLFMSGWIVQLIASVLVAAFGQTMVYEAI